MNLDLQKTAQENLIELIKLKNPGFTLGANNFDFSTPIVLTPEESANTVGNDNTKITLTAKTTAPVEGSVTITYLRPTVEGNVIANAPDFLNVASNATEESIKSLIATNYGLLESELDFSGEEAGAVLAPAVGDFSIVNVKAKSGSILYANSLKPFKVVLGEVAGYAEIPAGSYQERLDLAVLLGSPSTAGLYVIRNKGTIRNDTTTNGATVHGTTAFPAGSKLLLINEGAIIGRPSSVAAVDQIARTAFNGNVAGLIGDPDNFLLSNEEGMIYGGGSRGQDVVITINESGTDKVLRFYGANAAGVPNIATPYAPSNNTATLTYVTITEPTIPTESIPGTGGVYDVYQSAVLVGRVTTGNGGQLGEAGGNASYTGLEGLTVTLESTLTSATAMVNTAANVTILSGNNTTQIVGPVS